MLKRSQGPVHLDDSIRRDRSLGTQLTSPVPRTGGVPPELEAWSRCIKPKRVGCPRLALPGEEGREAVVPSFTPRPGEHPRATESRGFDRGLRLGVAWSVPAPHAERDGAATSITVRTINDSALRLHRSRDTFTQTARTPFGFNPLFLWNRSRPVRVTKGCGDLPQAEVPRRNMNPSPRVPTDPHRVGGSELPSR